MPSLTQLTALRKRLIDHFGTAGIHAIEDGLALGAIIGLWVTFPAAAVALAVGLGASPKRASLLAVLPELVGMIRGEDARRQESYFVGGALGGSVLGYGIGFALRTGARLSGVPVPSAADILARLV